MTKTHILLNFLRITLKKRCSGVSMAASRKKDKKDAKETLRLAPELSRVLQSFFRTGFPPKVCKFFCHGIIWVMENQLIQLLHSTMKSGIPYQEFLAICAPVLYCTGFQIHLSNGRKFGKAKDKRQKNHKRGMLQNLKCLHHSFFLRATSYVSK